MQSTPIATTPSASAGSASGVVALPALGRSQVLDTAGRPVRLEALWQDRAVVLFFVRHFGCLFCKEQVAEVEAARARFEARGAHVVVIGNGSVDEARAFAAQHPAVTLLTDPTREAYCDAGMKRGLGTALSLDVFKHARRAMKSGFKQTRTHGDALQQGGVIVVARGGEILFHRASMVAGDHPPMEDVIAALG